MDSAVEPQHDEGDVMEVPEVDGELLVELLDASLAGAEEAADTQLGFTADIVDGDGWDGQELNCTIHPHDGCEDCGLDSILSGFELQGSGCSGSPAPYVVFDDDDDDTVMGWTEAAEAALGPFTGECVGEWYMDGMAMEWEEDAGSWCSFGPYSGGEAGTEQVYGTALWE
ncbi:hypothetical protein ACP70R_036765 [Stipagrostis hirtigluma subsp. patula]